MLKITQIKLPLKSTISDLEKKIIEELKIKNDQLLDYKIDKKSIDARKKEQINIVYTVIVNVKSEKKILSKLSKKNIMIFREKPYKFIIEGTKELKERPVIIGSGPAGLFCALLLAQNGYKPIVLERGKPVEERIQDIKMFFKKGTLNINSNIQFGEGGAGTFSDGKLNTRVKDPYGRHKKVLEVLVDAGAPSEILYINQPHIGTDYLVKVVKNIRKKIEHYGGTVLFNQTLTDFEIINNKLQAIIINNEQRLPCKTLILAIGHSARDTFSIMQNNNIHMESKSFAVGVRIEHPQIMISKQQYGLAYNHPNLPVAEYKLTHKSSNGRGVYTFCMCPGGVVVNASSEIEGVVTNGMSNFKRNEKNANSAVIVTVTPKDFDYNHPLAGVEFQKKLERLAYNAGGANYNIPIQLFEDFCHNRTSKSLGDIQSSVQSKTTLANLLDCLPSYIIDSIKEGIIAFDKKINGFARPDAILSGVETRTSSPLRVFRNEVFESNIRGIYPCGEGAGYAGGITSAAMDGIKVAEAVAKYYKPIEKN